MQKKDWEDKPQKLQMTPGWPHPNTLTFHGTIMHAAVCHVVRTNSIITKHNHNSRVITQCNAPQKSASIISRYYCAAKDRCCPKHEVNSKHPTRFFLWQWPTFPRRLGNSPTFPGFPSKVVTLWSISSLSRQWLTTKCPLTPHVCIAQKLPQNCCCCKDTSHARRLTRPVYS